MSKDLIKKSDYTCWFKILPNMSIYSSFDNCTYLNSNDLLQRADKQIVDEFNQFILHRPEASILKLHEWDISSPVILDVYFELLLGSLLSSSYHTFNGDFSTWKNDDRDMLPFMRFKEWVNRS